MNGKIKAPRYLVRWKAKHMVFWRWTWIVSDSLLRRTVEGDNKPSTHEYLVMYKKNGARFEVPYGETCFLFGARRAKIISELLAKQK